MICISTLCFILSTLPELQDEEDYEDDVEDISSNTSTTPAAVIGNQNKNVIFDRQEALCSIFLILPIAFIAI